jgi:DNA repair protein RadC
MQSHDRPRERLTRLGPRVLSDLELMELLIGSGTKGAPVQVVANELLKMAGGLRALSGWEVHDFQQVHGLGPAKAMELMATVEFARRLREQAFMAEAKIDSPEKVWQRLEPLATGLAVEKCWVLSLNRRHRLLALQEISSGTATSAMMHAREVFRNPLRHAACGVIAVHNHPSGDPMPSEADRKVTRQLMEAGNLLGINLVDHVIIGRPECDPLSKGWFSFGENGLI